MPSQTTSHIAAQSEVKPAEMASKSQPWKKFFEASKLEKQEVDGEDKVTVQDAATSAEAQFQFLAA